MLTVTDVLVDTAARHGEREAYVDGDRRLTYRELLRGSSGVATALREMGVGFGDVVSILVPSSIDFALVYFAAMRLGAITSAVNPRLGAKERSSIAARTRPVVSLAADDGQIGPEWGSVLRVGSLTDAAALEPSDPDPLIGPDTTVAIVWTSGTTGLPKGALYDHSALRAIHEGMGPLSVPGDRRVVSLPFAHVGYMTRTWDDMVNAVTMVLVSDPWSADKQLGLIESEQITMVTGVPTQWLKMLEHPALEAIDTSKIRLAGIGGAAVAPELVRLMRERLQCPVMTRYTSTEAGLATSTQLSDSDEVIATTVGVPSSVVSMRLVATDGSESEVARGDVGEIRLRSAAMFRGYWEDPVESAAALDDQGYLRTGDLGLIGADGNLRIVGRLKEMYIRGGYNVYPVEVEAVLSEHPAIAAAAVVGCDAPVVGEIGVAFVVVAPEVPTPTLADLRDWCRAQLADYKSPERVVFVEELPVNAMHKIDKPLLRERAKEYV